MREGHGAWTVVGAPTQCLALGAVLVALAACTGSAGARGGDAGRSAETAGEVAAPGDAAVAARDQRGGRDGREPVDARDAVALRDADTVSSLPDTEADSDSGAGDAPALADAGDGRGDLRDALLGRETDARCQVSCSARIVCEDGVMYRPLGWAPCNVYAQEGEAACSEGVRDCHDGCDHNTCAEAWTVFEGLAPDAPAYGTGTAEHEYRLQGTNEVTLRDAAGASLLEIRPTRETIVDVEGIHPPEGDWGVVRHGFTADAITLHVDGQEVAVTGTADAYHIGAPFYLISCHGDFRAELVDGRKVHIHWYEDPDVPFNVGYCGVRALQVRYVVDVTPASPFDAR